MKINFKVLFIFLFPVIIFVSHIHSKVKFTYVGTKSCKKCHESDSIGNQYGVWKRSPHARAYSILKTAEALEISKKYNIKVPSEEMQCLKCHTTGSGKNQLTQKEGVGCEACHGPGSSYYHFSNHVSFSDRKNAYQKAIKHGMYPIIGIDGIKLREKLCLHCHKNSRPCAPQKSKHNNQKTLPLSSIADFIFRHSIRK